MPSKRRTLTGWNRQQMPPVGVVLNEQHWAAPNVVVAYCCNEGAGQVINDLARRYPSKCVSNWSPAGGAVCSRSYRISSFSLPVAQPITMHVDYTQGSSWSQAYFMIVSSGGGAYGIHKSLGNTTLNTPGGSWSSSYNSTNFPAGIRATITGARDTYNGYGTGTMYKDAVARSSSAYGLASLTEPFINLEIGNTLGSYVVNGAMRLALWLSIRANDAQVADLHNNPWGLVRLPLRRFYSIPDAAATIGISRGRTIETTGRLHRASATGGD